MLVTHDMLEKSTPVCIAFNHMPWDYLAVARLDIGGGINKILLKNV